MTRGTLKMNLCEYPGHHGKFYFKSSGPLNGMFWITLGFLVWEQNIISVLNSDSF